MTELNGRRWTILPAVAQISLTTTVIIHANSNVTFSEMTE